MNSSFMNMAAGAFLGTCFVAMTLSIVSGAIYYSPAPEKEGFTIKAAEPSSAGTAAPAKAEIPPIAPLLATADAQKGAQIFKKCEACHDATKGGPNKIGPNLYGVVGRPIASHPGFNYSSALKDFSENSKKTWTYELLNHWIHGPRDLVAGTSMTFPGVKKDQERADVIAYLHTLADKPVPFPKPESGKSASADKDGKGEAAKPAPGTATGDQSSKTESAAPSNAAPAAKDANSGSKANDQKATQQNPAAQGSNSSSAPATQGGGTAGEPANQSTTKPAPSGQQ